MIKYEIINDTEKTQTNIQSESNTRCAWNGHKNARERHDHDLTKINKIFALTIDAAITDLKRLGKCEDGKAPLTVIVNVSDNCQKAYFDVTSNLKRI